VLQAEDVVLVPDATTFVAVGEARRLASGSRSRIQESMNGQD